jgi:CHAD domain-containing protein
MKARKVKGLDPEEPFAEAAKRIAQVREEELRSFWPAARDREAVEALHDMRIAAKRLRYVLELATPALGSEAHARAKQARELQDVLGEIHDCDVMLPLLDGHKALTDRFQARRERLRADFLDMWGRMES